MAHIKPRGAVLVTGASSGIGIACALRLDARGYRVFAGVLRLEDGVELQKQASSRLELVPLDLRDAASIQNALDFVSPRVGEAGLHALINNAGVLGCAPLELLSLDAARDVFEINVLGQIALTQALLPLLRRARGRIINIGSLAGRSALPFTSPYNASKWAFRALNDTWRVELRGQGIRVVLIEPGLVKTPIWKTSNAVSTSIAPETLALYPSFAAHSQSATQIAARSGVCAADVAALVLRALQSPRPKPHLFIGREAPLLLWLGILPVGLRDWLIARRFGL